jgi:hypothetical protein
MRAEMLPEVSKPHSGSRDFTAAFAVRTSDSLYGGYPVILENIAYRRRNP